MKTMMWLKLKFAAGVGVAALLAGCSESSDTPAVATNGRQEIAEKSREAYAALSEITAIAGRWFRKWRADQHALNFEIRLQRPNLYRIDWTRETKGLPSPSNKGSCLV
jgi:hypothetical protein